MTPSVLPISSGPANCDLPFSTSAGMSLPRPLSPLTQSMLPSTSRDESTSEQRICSLTASAFAPGELNTTMPRRQQSSSGMLFVPAPERAMAIRLGSKA